MKKEAEVAVMRLLAEGHKLRNADSRSWRRLSSFFPRASSRNAMLVRP